MESMTGHLWEQIDLRIVRWGIADRSAMIGAALAVAGLSVLVGYLASGNAPSFLVPGVAFIVVMAAVQSRRRTLISSLPERAQLDLREGRRSRTARALWEFYIVAAAVAGGISVHRVGAVAAVFIVYGTLLVLPLAVEKVAVHFRFSWAIEQSTAEQARARIVAGHARQ